MHGALLKLRWFLLYLVSRAGLLLPRRAISTRFAYSVAVRVAWLCWIAFVGPRRKLIANLARVIGDERQARRIGRAAFDQYARYIIDLFQLPALGPEAIRERTLPPLPWPRQATLSGPLAEGVPSPDPLPHRPVYAAGSRPGWEALDAVLAEGRGTIFATVHFGHWEIGGAVLAANGYRMSAIARTLEFSPINDLIQGFRRELSIDVIPAEKAALGTMRCLARNGAIGMLIDMVDPGEGVLVDFFGGKAEMSPGPARIALRSGARIVPAVIVRDPHDDCLFQPVVDTELAFEPTGDEEADVQALTQRMATAFEALIRRYPDQWYAFRPVWREEGRPKAEVDWNDRLNHFALEAANLIFSRLPKPAAYAVARVVGDLAYWARKGIRADVQDNMRHVLGPDAPESAVEDCGREVFRNVCRYYADLIRFPRTRPENLMSKEIKMEGFERLQKAMAGGRGAVIATAHFGNPEVAPQIAALLGLDAIVLSEPLNPPAFSDLVHRLREANGVRYEEVGYKTIGRALAHLRKGGTLAITCDRDIQSTGFPLLFFGAETRMPLGAAELAARTGAVMVPAYCKRAPNGYEILFEEPIEVVNTGRTKADAVETTKLMIERMEAWIASDPGQWMVLERIWKPVARGAHSRGKPALGSTTPTLDPVDQ